MPRNEEREHKAAFGRTRAKEASKGEISLPLGLLEIKRVHKALLWGLWLLSFSHKNLFDFIPLGRLWTCFTFELDTASSKSCSES